MSGRTHLHRGTGGRIPLSLDEFATEEAVVIYDRLLEKEAEAQEARLARAAERKAFLAPRRFSWEGEA